MAAGGVDDIEGWAVGRRPLVAPLTQGGDDQPQVPPFVGEPVLVAGWMLLIGDPFEHTVLDEPAEALIQHVPGDPEAGLEVVEPPDPEKGVAQDQ
jgi:hypothetical protein